MVIYPIHLACLEYNTQQVTDYGEILKALYPGPSSFMPSLSGPLGSQIVCFLYLKFMNNLNKTKAAISPCRLSFLRTFPFSQIKNPTMVY